MLGLCRAPASPASLCQSALPPTASSEACLPTACRDGGALQVKEYYGEYNTLERGQGAVMKESQKVRQRGLHACAALLSPPTASGWALCATPPCAALTLGPSPTPHCPSTTPHAAVPSLPPPHIASPLLQHTHTHHRCLPSFLHTRSLIALLPLQHSLCHDLTCPDPATLSLPHPPTHPPTLPQVADLVDKFYSLVTDLYEWGWGQSFHFSRKLPNRDWAASEVAHEAWAAATIRLGPGKTALDVGCGVGGPMRTVAAVRCGAAAAAAVVVACGD